VLGNRRVGMYAYAFGGDSHVDSITVRLVIRAFRQQLLDVFGQCLHQLSVLSLSVCSLLE
jgi:hypothetical protein